MKLNNLIFSIEIPDYIREVQLSESRRAVYYEWRGNLGIRAWKSSTSKGKQIPKSFINDETNHHYIYDKNLPYQPHDLKSKFKIAVVVNGAIKGFWDCDISMMYKDPTLILNHSVNLALITEKQKAKAKLLLYDSSKESLVLSNPKTAGTPNTYIINGQDFYSGNLHPNVRAKVVTEIKKSFTNRLFNHQNTPFISYYEYLVNNLQFKTIYPLFVLLEVHDTIKNKYDKTNCDNGIAWDIGNRAYLPYLKTMLDLLVTGHVSHLEPAVISPVLKDDDRLHIAGEGMLFVPIPENETPKLVYKFYQHQF